jgi:primosomal protein N' (replication factor Y)
MASAASQHSKKHSLGTQTETQALSGSMSPAEGPRFADCILPLPLADAFTYRIPDALRGELVPGHAVEVPFGNNKLYSAVVARLHNKAPEGFEVKDIIGLVDDAPVAGEAQLAFWRWMAGYYAHPLGDVMTAALPGPFRLQSETRIVRHPDFDPDAEDAYRDLDDKGYAVALALSERESMNLKEVQQLLQRKIVHGVLRDLMARRIVELEEEFQTRYKPKIRKCIALAGSLDADRVAAEHPDGSEQQSAAVEAAEDALQDAFESIERRAPKQLAVLLAVLAHAQGPAGDQPLYRNQLLRRPELGSSGPAALKALLDKGILEERELTVSRLNEGLEEGQLPLLSPLQQQAYAQVREGFAEGVPVLLHGVTGSGKTALYLHAMDAEAREGRQALYLVPEIALTSQLVGRLRAVFGDRIGVYHSRSSAAERVETWQAAASGKLDFVIGARSAVFLPFRTLGLIVVDEEHDASFKQFDPSPRYHARDAAVWLARAGCGRVLLGSATPSLESMHNALEGKYRRVALDERYGSGELPTVRLVDLRREAQTQRLEGHLSSTLAERMQAVLDGGDQVILFQNRRGYAPTLRCQACSWVPQCVRCDVSLTYHKHSHDLRCHLCAYRKPAPSSCPACGSARLVYQGFGTEKIEDELALRFPEARVARMDLDTARGKQAHERLVHGFEQRDIDILVGTQMVTKGLDFEGVKLVGILSADALLWFPDFRSQERAFQLMAQVSGRAGRRGPGEVLIQAWDTKHPVLQHVVEHDYARFYQQELAQRRHWGYPPFLRLIRLTVSHRDAGTAADAARFLAKGLVDALGNRVLGPAAPAIARIRNRYRQEILLKLEKDATLGRTARAAIRNGSDRLAVDERFKQVRVAVDVDPW